MGPAPEGGAQASLWSLPRPDRYEPRELLGSGSAGMVFRVLDRESGREVALKTLVHAGPTEAMDLKREFRSLEHLVHENLVQLYDLEVSEEHCYFTMELIEGQDLRAHLCGEPAHAATDPGAVRDAFTQLVHGLVALHQSGKLHRDVKPQNVRVEPKGRIVLLDYGLVMGMERALSVASQRAGFAGTLQYTSPEQAWGQAIDEAADWYSCGVLLYECLTGRLPFEAASLGALLDRQHRAPAAPEDRLPEVDPELAALARDLLHYDPVDRPGGAQILSRLEGEPTAAAPPARQHTGPRAPFVGRASELRNLVSAYDTTRSGKPAAIRVEGVSGIGKSTLVERFLSDLESSEGALVLRSRCHPQESVRFDAIDGWVDDLSRWLPRQPDDQLNALQPEGVPALNRVFPVLARVEFGALRRQLDLADADPLELRRRAFASLRQLLTRIALRRPLVLWADDLQWGDRDSAAFLAELFRGSDPPPLLLVLSYRAEDREGSALLAELDDSEVGPLREARAIELGPLEDTEAGELMELLLRDSDPDAAQEARALASEAAGSPFFVGELVRYLQQREAAASEQVELAEVLGERMSGLSDDARALLELVAAAGRPISTDLILAHASLDRGGSPRVYELCRRSWLRTDARGERLDVYHGRMRDAVLSSLGAERLRGLHRDLARALADAEDSDAGEVLEHFLAAGDHELAAAWAVTGADQAASALAFDRAAGLYQQAFDLRGGRDGDWELLRSRAEALANAAGRSELAGRGFEAAALAVESIDGDSHTALELRGHAAQQYLYAGELHAGTELLRSVLHALDVPLPESPAEAIRAALRYRLRFFARHAMRSALRLPLFNPRPESEIEESDLVRLDIVEGASRGLSMLSPTLSDALSAAHLVDALAVREPARAYRALAFEAAFESTVGGRWLRRRSTRILAQVEAAASELDDPYVMAWYFLSSSNAAWMMGRWRACVELGDAAVEQLRERCIGVSWELTVNHVYTTSARAQLGRIRSLRERLVDLYDEAQSRGDDFALQAYRNNDTILVPLADDDPARARGELEPANDESSDALTSAAYSHLLGSVQIHLYEGAGDAALEQIRSAWSALGRSGFLRLECVGLGLRACRARAALAASAALTDARSRERDELVSEAEAAARRIARSQLPHALPVSAALLAGVAGARGRDSDRIRQLEIASGGFSQVEMELHAEATRWQLGHALGGERGVQSITQAENWMQTEGVRNPPAIASMLCPPGR